MTTPRSNHLLAFMYVAHIARRYDTKNWKNYSAITFQFCRSLRSFGPCL